ncbi:MAG: prepilin-type N-terminal cleavage/methylation domain-containing protein [Luteolibacter sp.]
MSSETKMDFKDTIPYVCHRRVVGQFPSKPHDPLAVESSLNRKYSSPRTAPFITKRSQRRAFRDIFGFDAPTVVLSRYLRMKFIRKPKNNNGFTLVELLVVVVIIAALAALSLTIGPRMMAKAKANQSMQNIRQIGPIVSVYAADHSMKLPAAKGPVAQPDNKPDEILQWNEVCLAVIYPETDHAEFKTKKWWDSSSGSKCFLRNPLLKDPTWAPLNPGYAMNEMIVENITTATEAEAPADPLAVSVALATIPDPGRTPLIAPYSNWHYRYDASQIRGFNKSPLKELLIDGKIPVLFVDGHIEVLTPQEYVDRKLFAIPSVPKA